MTAQLSIGREQSTPRFMPDIVDVMEAFDAAGGDAEAIAWLADNDVGPPPIPVKLLRVTCSNDFELPGFESANGTLVYSIIAGEPNCLAFPIYREEFAVDLMLIGLEEMDYATVCQEADWLGENNLDADVVRLHLSPFDWLEAGCTGVVQTRCSDGPCPTWCSTLTPAATAGRTRSAPPTE